MRVGTETLMLVEDERVILSMLQRDLSNAGYTVLAAPNAMRALELCAEHKGTIELLITDIVMPTMSGPALAAQMLVWRPELKVLYLSGYGDAFERYGDLAPSTVLLKPFTLVQLRAAVRELLDDGYDVPACNGVNGA